MTGKYDHLEMPDVVLAQPEEEERRKQIADVFKRVQSLDPKDVNAFLVGVKVDGHDDAILVTMGGVISDVHEIYEVLTGKLIEMHGIHFHADDERPDGEAVQ